MAERFRPSDVPRYSKMLWETVRSPVVAYLFLAGNSILVAASLGFYWVEAGVNPAVNGVLDAFWWGIATITTVGFGDIAPITLPGRCIGFALIATGVLLFVGSSAIVSSAFFARTRAEIIDFEEESKAEWHILLSELRELRREVSSLRASGGSQSAR